MSQIPVLLNFNGKPFSLTHGKHYELDSYGPKIIRVMQACTHEQVDEAEAGEFLNIEEGPQGEDILTYKCALCGAAHQSRRFG